MPSGWSASSAKEQVCLFVAFSLRFDDFFRYVVLPSDFEEAWKQTVKKGDDKGRKKEILPPLNFADTIFYSWSSTSKRVCALSQESKDQKHSILHSLYTIRATCGYSTQPSFIRGFLHSHSHLLVIKLPPQLPLCRQSNSRYLTAV